MPNTKTPAAWYSDANSINRVENGTNLAADFIDKIPCEVFKARGWGRLQGEYWGIKMPSYESDTYVQQIAGCYGGFKTKREALQRVDAFRAELVETMVINDAGHLLTSYDSKFVRDVCEVVDPTHELLFGWEPT